MVYTYRNRETLRDDDFRHFRAKLNDLFEALQTQRLYARQNFSCCGSCASYELSEKLRASQTKRTPKLGFVTYNRQDNQNVPYGYVYLGYSSIGEAEEDRELGRLIVDTATRVGLATEWDGNINSKVRVIAPCKASPIKNPNPTLEVAV
jgi:hypothetical protein